MSTYCKEPRFVTIDQSASKRTFEIPHSSHFQIQRGILIANNTRPSVELNSRCCVHVIHTLFDALLQSMRLSRTEDDNQDFAGSHHRSNCTNVLKHDGKTGTVYKQYVVVWLHSPGLSLVGAGGRPSCGWGGGSFSLTFGLGGNFACVCGGVCLRGVIRLWGGPTEVSER